MSEHWTIVIEFELTAEYYSRSLSHHAFFLELNWLHKCTPKDAYPYYVTRSREGKGIFKTTTLGYWGVRGARLS